MRGTAEPPRSPSRFTDKIEKVWVCLYTWSSDYITADSVETSTVDNEKGAQVYEACRQYENRIANIFVLYLLNKQQPIISADYTIFQGYKAQGSI